MTTERRLWIIDPSARRPEEQGVAEILHGWTGSFRLFRPGLHAEEVPPAAGYDADAIVLMGSAASVHDEIPWLAAVSDWLRPLVCGEVRVPVLGICFGHQLIAHLAGGVVDWVAADRAKLVGVARSNLSGGRLLPGDHELSVVVSHREEVKRKPPGFRVCASRGAIAIDGLEHERLPLFSFQFHPEARDEFAAHAGIPVDQIDARIHDDGRRLLRAFLDRTDQTGSDYELSDRKT